MHPVHLYTINTLKDVKWSCIAYLLLLSPLYLQPTNKKLIDFVLLFIFAKCLKTNDR